MTSDKVKVDVHQYKDVIHESIVQHSSAKHVKNKRESLMVGVAGAVQQQLQATAPEGQGGGRQTGP